LLLCVLFLVQPWQKNDISVKPVNFLCISNFTEKPNVLMDTLILDRRLLWPLFHFTHHSFVNFQSFKSYNFNVEMSMKCGTIGISHKHTKRHVCFTLFEAP